MAVSLPSIHVNPVVVGCALKRSNPSHQLMSNRAMVISMANSNDTSTNHSYWTSISSDIDTHLKQAIPIKSPVVVFEPMHHLTFAAPRTSAPALCIAACELVGGCRDHALAAASALHLMHAAAFAHENLPLTDKPRPTTRPIFTHRYEPNLELLAADGMIPFGFELLAKLDQSAQNNSDRILRVIIEISHTMGSQGMTKGRYNELHYEKSDGYEWLHHVCRKKEGVLHACAGACGAILGGGNEEETEKLRRYGHYVGMIQGIFNKVERNEEWSLKEVNELKDLAMKELKDFNQEKVGAISSLVESKFCNV